MNTLSKLARELESCIVDETGLCTVDDYRIVINFNMPHYEINGSYNAVGDKAIVNMAEINGSNNLNMGGISTNSPLDEYQKVLFDIYNRLDTVSQARLITYASKLSKRGGEVA